MRKSGGRFHPSRISGRQKQLRARDANEAVERLRRKRVRLQPIDTRKQDWSI